MESFELLRQREHDESVANYVKYIKLVLAMNHGNPSQADSNRLAKIVEDMGMTIEEAEADAKAVVEMNKRLILASEYEARTAAAVEARKKMDEAKEKWRQFHLEYNAASAVIARTLNLAQSQRSKSVKAREELEALGKAKPLILAALKAMATEGGKGD